MKLYLMQYAYKKADHAPYPGYLIRTDDGKNVLIDTGFPKTPAGQAPNTNVQMDEEDYVLNHLARLGLGARDIDYLISTHFDPDHSGNHDAFPDAEFVVQRVHYEAAKRGEQIRWKSNKAHWDAPGLHYRLVDGDTELLPGIELIETSGHVPGHQSVLVRLPKSGPIILAIDAITGAQYSDPETRPLGPFDMDEAGVRKSTRKLMDLAQKEQASLVVFGHDAEQWRNLKQAPDFYE